LLKSLKKTIGDPDAHSDQPVLIVSPDLRPTIRSFFKARDLAYPVLSQNEISSRFRVHPLGVIEAEGMF
jgi:flagellar biosynthesis component FlhA